VVIIEVGQCKVPACRRGNRARLTLHQEPSLHRVERSEVGIDQNLLAAQDQNSAVDTRPEKYRALGLSEIPLSNTAP
jgi:hypothetical protein